ncbi:hypothetical protein NN561_001375 [Cricetulus griseus]
MSRTPAGLSRAVEPRLLQTPSSGRGGAGRLQRVLARRLGFPANFYTATLASQSRAGVSVLPVARARGGRGGHGLFFNSRPKEPIGGGSPGARARIGRKRLPVANRRGGGRGGTGSRRGEGGGGRGQFERRRATGRSFAVARQREGWTLTEDRGARLSAPLPGRVPVPSPQPQTRSPLPALLHTRCERLREPLWWTAPLQRVAALRPPRPPQPFTLSRFPFVGFTSFAPGIRVS